VDVLIHPLMVQRQLDFKRLCADTTIYNANISLLFTTAVIAPVNRYCGGGSLPLSVTSPFNLAELWVMLVASALILVGFQGRPDQCSAIIA